MDKVGVGTNKNLCKPSELLIKEGHTLPFKEEEDLLESSKHCHFYGERKNEVTSTLQEDRLASTNVQVGG